MDHMLPTPTIAVPSVQEMLTHVWNVWESEGGQAETETHMFPVYSCGSSYSELT